MVFITHLSNENPDEPKPPGDNGHDTVADKFPKTVSFPLNHIYEHKYLLPETKKIRGAVACATVLHPKMKIPLLYNEFFLRMEKLVG